MHATMPVRAKKITITLAKRSDWKVRRGHSPHRGGAGVHFDRRTNRLRTRPAQRQASLAEQ